MCCLLKLKREKNRGRFYNFVRIIIGVAILFTVIGLALDLFIVSNIGSYKTDQFCCGFLGGNQDDCTLKGIEDAGGFNITTNKICQVNGKRCDTYTSPLSIYNILYITYP